MSQIIHAIYEKGVLKPLESLNLREYARVRIQISMVEDFQQQVEHLDKDRAEKILMLARSSCEGLSEEELSIMENTKIDETHFFSSLGESK